MVESRALDWGSRTGEVINMGDVAGSVVEVTAGGMVLLKSLN
jgi:hypothetical protein